MSGVPRSKRHEPLILLALLGGIILLAMYLSPDPYPHIPAFLKAELPLECRQLLVVNSPHQDSVKAELWLMERNGGNAKWRVKRGPIPVTLGWSGLGWGRGEHRSEKPVGFREKVEGDGCSPAGIFRIPFAFGLAPLEEAAPLKLPYTFLTPDIFGIEAPTSKYYNQVVDVTKVERDWDDSEHDPMSRRTTLYRWGAFIGHNPERIPHAGSCIFMHRWSAPGEPTAGCTGMSEQALHDVLFWIDPALEPRLMQVVVGW